MTADDLGALLLSLRLAGTVTVLLLLLGTPLAWWLAQGRSRWRTPVAALTALPLVLPPTVLGFYLLVALAPQGPLGSLARLTGVRPFTFAGLVLASLIYSLPFVVQPLRATFDSIGSRPLEVAATLRVPPLRAFFTVILPLARPGLLGAAVLGFAHTVGEFGVVLMMGGNIPGRTRVLSLQLYNHVEAMEYGSAQELAGILLLFSFAVLLLVYRRRGALPHV